MTTQPNRRRASDDFERCPMFDKHELTEEQIIELVKKAYLLSREEMIKDVSEHVKNQFLLEVGKTVVNKVFILVGMISVAIYLWARQHNIV